jgi:hypothetical protein
LAKERKGKERNGKKRKTKKRKKRKRKERKRKEKKEKEMNRKERKEKGRKIKEKKGKERRTPYIAKAFSANSAHFTKDWRTKYRSDPAPTLHCTAKKIECKEERNCLSLPGVEDEEHADKPDVPDEGVGGPGVEVNAHRLHPLLLLHRLQEHERLLAAAQHSKNQSVSLDVFV